MRSVPLSSRVNSLRDSGSLSLQCNLIPIQAPKAIALTVIQHQEDGALWPSKNTAHSVCVTSEERCAFSFGGQHAPLHDVKHRVGFFSLTTLFPMTKTKTVM